MTQHRRWRRRTPLLALAPLALVACLVTLNASSDPDYERGMEALDRRDWRGAVAAFDSILERGGARSDAALYWKAYALSKRGDVDGALLSIERLDARYPDSRWREQARALRLELRDTVGDRDHDYDHDVDVDEEAGLDGSRPGGADELKLLALQGLLYSTPEEGLRRLERFIRGDHPAHLKEQAMFLLIQSGEPRASELLREIATGSPERELRAAAVRNLGVLGGESSVALLGEIFENARDAQMRIIVLEAWLVAGRADRLFAAARNDTTPEVRRQAVQYLGAMGAREELDALWSSGGDEIREVLLEAYMISGAREPVLRAAREARSEELRGHAVQLLGVMGAIDELRELYRTADSALLRERILDGFHVAGASDELARIAVADGPIELRVAAIERLGIASGDASVLGELYRRDSDERLRRAVLSAWFLRGDAPLLIEVARSEKDPELRAAAASHLALMDSAAAREFLMELLDDDE